MFVSVERRLKLVGHWIDQNVVILCKDLKDITARLIA